MIAYAEALAQALRDFEVAEALRVELVRSWKIDENPGTKAAIDKAHAECMALVNLVQALKTVIRP